MFGKKLKSYRWTFHGVAEDLAPYLLWMLVMPWAPAKVNIPVSGEADADTDTDVGSETD